MRVFDEFRNNAEMLNISFDDRMIYKHIHSKFGKRDILRFQSECTRDGLEINASNLRDWVEKARINVRSVSYGAASEKTKKAPNTSTFGKVFVASGSKGACNMCEEKGHALPTCQKFSALPVRNRLQHVRDNKLCFACLKSGHSAKECRNPTKCQCGRNHHPKLHKDAQGKTMNVKAFMAFGAEIPEEDEDEDPGREEPDLDPGASDPPP